MESLDPAGCFVEDLLDFSSDIGEDDDDDHRKRTRLPSSSSLLAGGHSRSIPVSFPLLLCQGTEFAVEPGESGVGFFVSAVGGCLVGNAFLKSLVRVDSAESRGSLPSLNWGGAGRVFVWA